MCVYVLRGWGVGGRGGCVLKGWGVGVCVEGVGG